MALHIRRKEKENPQSLVHRFTKVMRQSGILFEIKRKQFRKRAKSALAKKRSALRRIKISEEKKMQEKMAKPQ